MDVSKIGVPILGICLGMQLLTYFSAENGKNNGLRIIPGQIKKTLRGVIILDE